MVVDRRPELVPKIPIGSRHWVAVRRSGLQSSIVSRSARLSLRNSRSKRPSPRRVQARLRDAAAGDRATLNGQPLDVAAGTSRGYLDITRDWQRGDSITLDLPMPAERIFANPRVRADVGRVALRHCPLVYCLEATDNPDAAISQLTLLRDASIAAERKDVFDGIGALTARGWAITANAWNGTLYRADPPATLPAILTAVPYYLWANRDPGAMAVWVRED